MGKVSEANKSLEGEAFKWRKFATFDLILASLIRKKRFMLRKKYKMESSLIFLQNTTFIVFAIHTHFCSSASILKGNWIPKNFSE